jgi:hypothetical protein
MHLFPRVGVLLSLALGAAGQQPVPRLTAAQKAEARRLIAQIERDPRGPYGPIQWFCKDGRILPAQGTPCGKDGGFQHAAPGDAARLLAQMNFDLAGLLAGLPFAHFLDVPRNHFRLRETVMIDYLTARAGGWIYARTYARRGVRQAEDEEREGRRLLVQLLDEHAWVQRHYLLAVLAVSVTPHGANAGRLREIRALSTQIAEKDPRFQPLRGKIHSRPEASDASRVEEYLRAQKPADPQPALKLIELIRAEYSPAAIPAGWNFYAGADRGVEIRKQLMAGGLKGAERLALADELIRLQDIAVRSAAGLPAPRTRRQLAKEIHGWFRYAAAAGLLSFRQLDALEQELSRLDGRETVDAPQYDRLADYLENSIGWARAAALRELGEVIRHYEYITPLASGLLDDVLRRWVVLPLAGRIEMLAHDADAGVGRRHRVLEGAGSRGILALNPGIAIAHLEILENVADQPDIEPGRIYVIPATVADLRPMRGILTLDSGNALSHAQLLAANLGIPNATLPSSLLPALRKHRGEEMFYAVTPGGTVVLRPWNSLSEAEQSLWRTASSGKPKIAPDTSKLDLQDRALKTVEQATAADSGVRSGPKAAKLGQLRRHFPGMVAPGVVVPFGVYNAHISAKTAAGSSIKDEIRETAIEADRVRASGASPAAVRAFLRPRLARIRKAIRELALEPWFIDDLLRSMRDVFGPDGSYGVFVRSDTNAEDLPGFTGAGLNLSLPNVIGTRNILQGIKDVWASPFEERAYEWRAQALDSTVDVYPSIILLRSVPCDKSGVLATANLETLDTAELTVNVNEGVAAVVDGGIAESLLLEPGGAVRLLAQAQSPYRKILSPSGGLAEVPASGSDFVLTPREIEQLRQLARDVKERFPPERDSSGAALPWDIEFGFVQGELRLFQIRPLARFRETALLEALAAFDPNAASRTVIRLGDPPEGK